MSWLTDLLHHSIDLVNKILYIPNTTDATNQSLPMPAIYIYIIYKSTATDCAAEKESYLGVRSQRKFSITRAVSGYGRFTLGRIIDVGGGGGVGLCWVQ